jgi:AcrR family transcriptional regulator
MRTLSNVNSYPAAMASTKGSPPTARDAARNQVLQAARGRFLSEGLRANTMEDIAHAARTSRQTVYKYFSGRRELIEAAIAARIAELADEILDHNWSTMTLVEGFVARTGAIVQSIRDDHELGVLLGDGSPLTLHEALWQPSVRQRGLTDWRPWLREARRDGLVRGDVTDEDLYDWLQTVLTSVILRPTPDPAYERMLVETFLLKSLSGH